MLLVFKRMNKKRIIYKRIINIIKIIVELHLIDFSMLRKISCKVLQQILSLKITKPMKS